RPSLGVELGRAVLIAHTEGKREILGHAPFVLKEAVDGFAAQVVGGVGGLKEVVRDTNEEVSEAVPGADSSFLIGADKFKLAVTVEVVDSVVLVSGKTCACFPGVSPPDPCERIAKSVSSADQKGWARGIVSEGEAVVEKHAGRAIGKVGEDAKTKCGAGWQVQGRDVMGVIVALGNGVELIQQGWRKRASVTDVQVIVVVLI